MKLPAPNVAELGPGQAATPALAAGASPRAGWPAKGTLDYLKVGIELLLLVLAVPWILRELFRHPAQVSKAAAKHHLKG